VVMMEGASASPIWCVVNDARVFFPNGHNNAAFCAEFSFFFYSRKWEQYSRHKNNCAKNVTLGFHGTPLDWPRGDEETDSAFSQTPFLRKKERFFILYLSFW